MAFINNSIIELINYRIAQEELSSRLYKDMAINLDFVGLSGAAKLWYKYADEEMEHAEMSYKYLLDLDIKPDVPTLEAPRYQFESLEKVVIDSLNHELEVTEQINYLAKTGLEQNDFMVVEWAQGLLAEQRDEIEKTTYWKDRFEVFRCDDGKITKAVLFQIDEEMGNKE